MGSSGSKDGKKVGVALDLLSDLEEFSSQMGDKIEGTNEIFVSSRIFDALYASESQEEETPNGGLISGVLPSVSSDKSFDAPVISEELLSDDSLGPWSSSSSSSTKKTGDESEVFASKLKPDSGLHLHPDVSKSRLVVSSSLSSSLPPPLPQNKDKPESVQHFGLPPLSIIGDASHLHPEDVKSALKPLQTLEFPDFVIDHLYKPAWFDVLGRRLGAKVYTEQADLLFVHVDKVIDEERARFVTLTSMGSFCLQVFVTQFLGQFRRRYTNANLYGSILSASSSRFGHGLLSLLISRIGILPTDPDEVKTECLLSIVDNFIEEKDREWALSILFAVYGLEGLLRNPKYRFLVDSPEMLLPNVFELLRIFIERDSRSGVVLIVLTELCLNSQHGWREIVELVEGISKSRVLFLFAGCIEGREGADSWHNLSLPSIHSHQMRLIVGSILESVCDKPSEVVDVLTLASGGSLDQLLLSLTFLKARGVLRFEHAVWRYHADGESLELLGGASAHVAELLIASLSEEERYFLTLASVVGPFFEVSDLLKLLGLQGLEDEIPWFHDLRKRKTEQTLERFVDLGLLLPIRDDADVASSFELRQLGDLGLRLLARDPAYVRSISAFYAQILKQRAAQSTQMAEHFELGGLYGEACEAWLDIAHMASMSFLNATVHDILVRCAALIGPQHGVTYLKYRRFSAEYEMRFGHYDLAQNHYETMLRVGHLIEEAALSVDAFVGLSRSILMQGNYGQARDLLLFGLELAESLEDETRIADCYEGLAEIVFNASDKGSLVNALRYAEKALLVRRQAGELYPIARILLLMTKIYLVRGDLQSAQTCITESYHAHIASGSYFWMPEVLASMAYLEQESGETRQLVEHLNKAAVIARKTGHRRHLLYALVMRVRQGILTHQNNAVRRDLETIENILAESGGLPMKLVYLLLRAKFDFSRRNFKKTTRSLRRFFEQASVLRNPYFLSLGYVLSAELNVEVYRRKLGDVSLERTERLFSNAISVFESMGAWHEVAVTQRKSAEFLDALGRADEARKRRQRADKVDPYCQ